MCVCVCVCVCLCVCVCVCVSGAGRTRQRLQVDSKSVERASYSNRQGPRRLREGQAADAAVGARGARPLQAQGLEGVPQAEALVQKEDVTPLPADLRHSGGGDGRAGGLGVRVRGGVREEWGEESGADQVCGSQGR